MNSRRSTFRQELRMIRPAPYGAPGCSKLATACSIKSNHLVAIGSATMRALLWTLLTTASGLSANTAALYRVNSLRIRLIRLDRVTLDADVLMPAMEEHMAIIAALRTRDPRLAIAALDAHLNHARNRALGLSRTS